MKKEWALLDAITENENKIFTAAVILSAEANGRFASTMSWQIIAPALVMFLSSVRKTCSLGLGHAGLPLTYRCVSLML